MAKNRVETIRAAKDILNWNVKDSTYAALAIRFCNDAYKRTASECPPALIPDEIRERIPPTYTTGGGSASVSYISTTTDEFVLEFTDSANSTFSPEVDGSWNGLYWLEITFPSPNGYMWRGQCREFWTEVVGGVTKRYVSIMRPWAFGPQTNLQYRLFVPYLWFRDDYEEIIIGQRFGSNGNPLVTKNINTAIYSGQWSNQNDREWGYPSELRRENQYQHPAPNIAPVVEVDDQGTWGPEPWGEFDYCITYIWGYRDRTRKSPQGSFIPLFESSASPVSTSVTITGAGMTVVMTLPDVAWQLNYGDAATLRYGHSGWKKRIYRRRKSTTGGTNDTIEHPAVFQFLADVDDTVTSFTDDGSIVPDYTLRLDDIHGYYCWSMWPLVSSEEPMEYQLRATRRPEPLLNDYDSPRIVPSCEDALTFFLVSYMSRHDKDNATAELYETKAKQILAQYRSRIANPTGMVDRQGWDGPDRPSIGWPRAVLVP